MSFPSDSGVTYTTKTNNVDIINDSDVNNLQTEVTALKTKVGVDGSAVNTTHDYKLGEITSTDKAVGKTATQTLTNKTLTSPVVNVGSDATGDMYYRNEGALTRIPVGTDNQILKLNGTTPNWEAETATVDASVTVKGVVELATAAEITAATATGGTGAPLVVTPDALASSTPVFNGSGLTALNNFNIYKNGTDSSRAGNAAAGTQTIAHGCGKTPKRVKITATYSSGNNTTSASNYVTHSFGTYNGTTNSSTYTASAGTMYGGASYVSNTYGVYLFAVGVISHGDYERAVITFDSTNITLTWTMNNGLGSTNPINIMWEAEA